MAETDNIQEKKDLMNDLMNDVVPNKKYNYPFLMSIAKSGTHLTLKLLKLLTGKGYDWNQSIYGGFIFKEKYTPAEYLLYEEKMDQCHSDGVLLISHSNMALIHQNYINKHPEQKTIVHIRDLRDVFVSVLLLPHIFTRYDERPTKLFYPIKNILEDKEFMSNILLKIIKETNISKKMFDVYSYAFYINNFINNNKNNPNVYISKFELLVGSKGGGDDNAQEKEIRNIAKFANIELSEEKLNFIKSDLFGFTDTDKEITRIVPNKRNQQIITTFSKGQTGGWLKYFNEECLCEFEKKFGALQIALGYPIREKYVISLAN